jgi:hypothetical protein
VLDFIDFFSLLPRVEFHVLGVGPAKDEVADVVIRPVAVNVMDDFLTSESPADVAFHHQAMFKHVATINPDRGVASRMLGSAFPVPVSGASFFKAHTPFGTTGLFGLERVEVMGTNWASKPPGDVLGHVGSVSQFWLEVG